MAKQLEMMYEGKAKQVFATDDPTLAVIHYKDDATAFNGLKKGTVSYTHLTLPTTSRV